MQAVAEYAFPASFLYEKYGFGGNVSNCRNASAAYSSLHHIMTNKIVLDPQTKSIKTLAWWVYLLHGASLFLGLGMFSWIPLIVNYVKRGDAACTFVQGHHTWMIRTFWWGLGLFVLGYLLFLTLVGIPLALLIWFGAWVWAAYRLVKGFLTLNDNKSIGAYSVE